MLLEEFVTERVRTQERAAHTRELEQLRIIHEDDGARRETGWFARRRAARADTRAGAGAGAGVGVGVGVGAQPQPESLAETAPVAAAGEHDATAPLPQPTAQETAQEAASRPARERELQHAGR